MFVNVQSMWILAAAALPLGAVAAEAPRNVVVGGDFEAFELLRLDGPEIDPDAVPRSPVGNPLPLRPMRCRDGALEYEDGGEVALWGVNLQTALSWEYNARMQPCGIPLEAEALKRIADRNLDEMRQLGVGIVRMHLLPSDFSTAEGHIRDSILLDLLDYTMERCRQTGLYVYLTLVNEMSAHYYEDSFIVPRNRTDHHVGRKIWMVEEAYIRPTETYIRALLERPNRYSGIPLRDDTALAVIEIMNEPAYVSYDDMRTDPGFGELRTAFASWCAARDLREDLERHYRGYRYEAVRAYVDRMVAAVRQAGANQPVAWNLNWPRMIRNHEDVFQAVADSRAEVVSFCLYPGQSDVPSPYWKHPRDLSDTNYLPYLRDQYRDREKLRWLLNTRFAGKAKAVYEFETFFNQSAYLYPAMAALFRSLGAQVAHMWTYSLTPTAEFLQGSHHLNLYCTPRKAVSFAIAGRVFAATPRYTPYPLDVSDPLPFGNATVSFADKLSLWNGPEAFLNSGPCQAAPIGAPPAALRLVMGCGDSPLLRYDGTGIVSLSIGEDAIDLRINPDARFLLPPWDRQTARPWKRVCELDTRAVHRLLLRLPGWSHPLQIERIEGDGPAPVPETGGETTFRLSPGRYRITRAAAHP